MTHKKDGCLVVEVLPGDEVLVDSVRVIVKDKTSRGFAIAIQAPKELKIEMKQPWRRQGKWNDPSR